MRARCAIERITTTFEPQAGAAFSVASFQFLPRGQAGRAMVLTLCSRV